MSDYIQNELTNIIKEYVIYSRLRCAGCGHEILHCKCKKADQPKGFDALKILACLDCQFSLAECRCPKVYEGDKKYRQKQARALYNQSQKIRDRIQTAKLRDKEQKLLFKMSGNQVDPSGYKDLKQWLMACKGKVSKKVYATLKDYVDEVNDA